MAEYISHIRESDKKEQTVSEHSNNVAKIASEFGQAVQMSHTACCREFCTMLENCARILQNTFVGRVMPKGEKLTIAIWVQSILRTWQ